MMQYLSYILHLYEHYVLACMLEKEGREQRRPLEYRIMRDE